tara:strand:+ start:1631 stop:1936 length:306 start_codon:yes stop_codon:yes gene_type:complete
MNAHELARFFVDPHVAYLNARVFHFPRLLNFLSSRFRCWRGGLKSIVCPQHRGNPCAIAACASVSFLASHVRHHTITFGFVDLMPLALRKPVWIIVVTLHR